MGANVNMVRKGIGSDPRIGNKFIYAGIGYGGSCFPKDVKALVKTAAENGHRMRILEAVEDVNDSQKEVLFNKIMKHFDGDIKGKTFSMWGLSFKPNTDDMREAPSLVLIDKLVAQGAKVKAYDPVALEEAKHILGDKVTFAADEYEALVDSQGLLLVTEWSEFRVPNWKVVKKLMEEHVVFDGRNIYEEQEMKNLGFAYYGIGI
jgi:UDPglucose 6-dehydrogenase